MGKRTKLPLIALTAGLISLQAGAQTQTQDLNMDLYQLQFPSASGGFNRIQSYGGTTLGTWSFKSRFDNIVFDAGENSSNNRSILFNIGGVETARFTTNGYFGIGTTTPLDKLHVKYGTSGGSTYQAKGMTIENDTRVILQLLSNNTSDQFLLFGKASLANRAWVGYNHATNEMNFTHYSTAGNFVFDNGKVGIGTHAPMASLHVVVDGNGANIQRYAGQSGIYLRRAAGTEASPIAVVDGEQLGFIGGSGYNGTTYHLASRVQFEVDGEPNTGGSTTDMPGRITFLTNSDGTVSQTERMRITNDGKVGIGTTTPSVRFQVVGDGINFRRGNIPQHLLIERYNGTQTSPTIVLNNEQAALISGRGYDGTNGYQNLAQISMDVDGTPGAADMPGRIVFHTTPDGTATSVERMRINNIGNVGIGTTAPGDLDNTIKFTVESTTATSRMALIGLANPGSGSPSNSIWFMDRTNGSSNIKRVAAINTLTTTGGVNPGSMFQIITFQKNTGTANFALNIDDKGYVGIGSQSPQGTLHVIQDGNLTRIDRYAGGAGLMLRRANGNSTTPTAVASSDVLGTVSGYGFDGTSTYNAAAQIYISADGAGTPTAMPGRISFLTTPGGSVTPVEIVRINSAGKMGIGTTAPATKLHVMGVVSGEYAMTVEHSNSLGSGLLIKAGGAGSNMNLLTITDNAGGEILKVRGADKTLYVRELEVRIGAFPDYVFEKNYPLMPLSELEAYINKNKHLPNVPSAKEVEENGANVGNLVKVQMEKIEELTLYLIELKKENEEIKKQLEEIKNK